MSNLNNYKMSNKNKFNSILKHESGLKTLGSGFYKIGKLRGGFSFIEVIIASGLIGILLMASPQFYIAAQNLQAESKHKSIEQKISANINTIAGLKDSLLISQSFKSGPNYELKKCLTQAISYVPGSAPDCINNQSYPIFLYGPTSMPKNSSRTRILTRAFFGTDTEPSFYDTEGEPCDVPVKGECIYKVVGYFVPQCAVDSVSGSTFPSCDVPEVIKINYDISQMTFS